MCYALESESNVGNGSHLQATKPRDFCPCKPVQLTRIQYPGQNDLIFQGYLFNRHDISDKNPLFNLQRDYCYPEDDAPPLAIGWFLCVIGQRM